MGSKVCSKGPGHMTKMVASPMYGKNPLKSFFSRTRRRTSLDFLCNIGDVGPTNIFLRVYPFEAKTAPKN